jgi:hypothetical protein
MKEKILSVHEVRQKGWDGYLIKTTKQEIKLLIDNEQCCCESWGYFLSEDDFEDFIGAELLDIKLTDTELKKGLFKKECRLPYSIDMESELFSGGIMFVDLVTSKGVLQFTAYNVHNGYYGHDAKIVSKQLSCTHYL